MHKTGHIWMFFAIVLSLPVMLYAGVAWYERSVKKLPVLIGEEHRISDFNLIDQQGRTVTISDWKDKVVVANFFFTHCPSVCPKMVRNLKTVQESYSNDPAILIASYSVDPERDSVDVLAKYARRFDINGKAWQLITGAKKDIYRLARHSFKLTATDGDGGDEDFIHSSQLVLIDKEKRIRGYYDGTNTKETNQLIKDIKKIEDEH
jgi:protein SCO1